MDKFDYDKVPPQAREVEEVVLGALMLESDSFIKVYDVITADSFYVPAHRIIYQAIANLFLQNEAIDILTVTEELKHMNKLDEAGGAYYISKLTNKVSSSENLNYHALIIQQKFIQRELAKITGEFNRKAYSDEYDVFELISELQNKLLQITSTRTASVYKIDKVVKEVFDIVDFNIKNKGSLTGLATGFDFFDKFSNGLQNSDLIIIAGETSQGKTSLVLNICLNVALSCGKKVGILSPEMSRAQLGSRLMSQVSGISPKKILSSKLQNDDIDRLQVKVKDLVESNIYIDDCSSTNLEYVLGAIRSLKIKHDINMIAVDYLQLINNPIKYTNKEQQVADTARKLKNMAKEMDIPIILLSQLSRDKRDHKPSLSRLRDSGQIEEAADIIWLVHRPETYNIENIEMQDGRTFDSPGLAQMIIAKGRNIGTTEFILKFNKSLTSFSNIPSHELVLYESDDKFEELKK